MMEPTDGDNKKSAKLVPLDYDPGEHTDVAVRNKYKSALSQARSFEQFGKRILKIKMKTLAALGEEAQALGIKKIGHGKILVASENAEEAIYKLDELIDNETDPEIRAQLMQLRLGYNKLLLETGQAHIEAEKQALALNKSTTLTIPFSQGKPMIVAVKTDIEDTKPAE